ncbi:hypothetical protein AHAT_28940 [Agarivorans sp. Toyoura001]|uniref:hypothetical protein n=1 Tax=Agarivorans sp. Toyoura001 TaxID=2283141 RepID=UPI0010F2AD17|nr:hypothetical protein [Agarivorans sp. Toyoura001]GDY27004.1 hypothetical protein AHAT_28940 [Agarivorans sp. Toyoura001]
MEISHPTTIRVGKNDYDFDIISITKTYGGSKHFSDGINIYLEDNNGKVETMGVDFKPDIPPTTQHISTLWGEDKKTKKTFRFGYYLHSNDFLGYTSQANLLNAAKRIIPLQGFAAKLEKWKPLITGFLALLFAWSAFWAGASISRYGIMSFFQSIPYILIDTPHLISNFSDAARYNNVSYGWAFMGAIAGFVLSKLFIGIPLGRLRNKMRLAFAGSLKQELIKAFENTKQAAPAAPVSGKPSSDATTDADGYQTLI